ncbi:TonB-dependent receptor [Sphingomonas gilva]|uniref:TonB-dependent receptor n=1 Tax=Sphingomonas gilva TaxID=2305907 RepID=A0A396RZ93_9SPHN|nr:TonB-dependent receptor [Sphingomonas gilva]RHW19061.1 TonB-dependent receptor [Sphingomonas gilva]
MIGVAGACLIAVAAPAQSRPAEPRFQIAAQALDSALRDFGVQSGFTIMADASLTTGKRTRGYSDVGDPETALRALLRGTGLSYRRQGNVFIVTQAVSSAQASPPVGTQTPPPAEPEQYDTSQNIIVTAQKREESIQDVPIAVSAFSGESLDDLKIEGGSELLRAVPNVTFSKANFSGYNFSIRGIGTKAVSASTDPAVAVSFNNTPLIRNRLFEQEFFDIERVEVLRGPQGTLYGRNATGGVVNVLPELPVYSFEGMGKIEVGNYNTRRASGMINVPITDTFAVRAAGAYTKRDGFDYNSFNDTKVNGRDLWSTRLSAQWEPFDGFRANFIWQHFEEDDNRSRTGKQLCTRDDGPTMIGDTAVPDLLRLRMSQGCKPGSLFDDAAYGTPNAGSFPHVAVSAIGYGVIVNPDGTTTDVEAVPRGTDPYAGLVQSRNLREIATSYDPVFRAKNDLFQFNLELGLTDGLQLITQTAYAKDRYYSSQDYNRFVSNPIFSDSSDPDLHPAAFPSYTVIGPTPGGIYVDPQLGPSDRMLSVDISQSDNEQWTQEIRLQSSWDGPFNFNLGANYLDFSSQDDYYVFNNLFTFVAQYFYNGDPLSQFNHEDGIFNLVTRPCQPAGPDDASGDCIYVDPNPLGSINGLGHNYFRSKNVVRTESFAIFGESYLNIADNFKLTAGLRYTDDTKTATPYPSQLLLGIGSAMSASTGGRAAIGYPASPNINQSWKRFSGRLVADWKPQLSFTDDTLIYASFAHGYKGGGSNPPRVDLDPSIVRLQPLAETFAPEYVNAFEIGTKNSLMDGRMTFNATAFYYDYTNYQVSQIVDRISLNENFDATSMGIEFEAAWRPSRNFRIDANLGYLDTRIKDGAQSIDVMNRTQSNEDWVLVRPWLQAPSNCIAPKAAVEKILNHPFSAFLGELGLAALCASSNRIGDYDPAAPNGQTAYYALFGFTYDPLLPYDPDLSPLGVLGSAAPRSGAPNGGRGFYADLGSNELPNSPHLTFNIGAQYTFFLDAFELTFRGDYYRQSESFARVYNTEYDRLRGWDNANLAVTLENRDWDLVLQAYVKNVFDNTPITDTFTNSDDTGLTANVFTLDPRIIGFSVMKRF